MPAAVLTLGDSHGAVFRHPTFADRFPAVAWETVVVPGATASGLDNPNDSRTQAYPIFRRALDTTAARRVVVTLGEVDTGFVIWYRAAKHRESVFTMLDRAVAAYADFLAGIVGTFDVLGLSPLCPPSRTRSRGAPSPTCAEKCAPPSAPAPRSPWSSTVACATPPSPGALPI